MDLKKLTQRLRMLGIPILIPAAALVLVAYGPPDRNAEDPAAQMITFNIEFLGDDECTVTPFTRSVPPTSTIRFKQRNKGGGNRTGKISVLFPEGSALIPNGTAVASGTLKVIEFSTTNSQNFTVTDQAGAKVYYFDVYSYVAGRFCEKGSHPAIIVE